MKEIMAIIRMNKMAKTKLALVEAGYNGLTAIKAMGRGMLLRDLAMVENIKDENRDMVLESLLKGGRLIPKRLLSIMVRDADVNRVVDIIIQANQEGHVGDGKIFVLPLNDAVRVRTGEHGEDVV